MSVGITNGKFLLQDAGHHRRAPHAGKEAIGLRPAVDNVFQLLLLAGAQLSGTSRAMSLQQCLPAELFVIAQPLRHFGAGRVQDMGDVAAAQPVVIEQDGVEAPGDAMGPRPLRLPF